MTASITPETALIYTMVIVSAADSEMTDPEIRAIGGVVQHLPAFKAYQTDLLTKAAEDCAALLAEEDGLETVIGLVKQALPERLRETAYALACDIAAADLHVEQEELRLLELLRHHLEVDRLAAAAIERGARARHARI